MNKCFVQTAGLSDKYIFFIFKAIMEVLQDNEQLDAHLKKITEGPGQVSDLQNNTTEV